MSRTATADFRGHSYPFQTVDLFYVEHLQPIEHPDVNGFSAQGGKLL